uniref:Uncharacterized protein n=1 Tax=Arundo donax TaxID=35708 RepID=A0A0A9DZS2_ARUDO
MQMGSISAFVLRYAGSVTYQLGQLSHFLVAGIASEHLNSVAIFS